MRVSFCPSTLKLSEIPLAFLLPVPAAAGFLKPLAAGFLAATSAFKIAFLTGMGGAFLADANRESFSSEDASSWVGGIVNSAKAAATHG